MSEGLVQWLRTVGACTPLFGLWSFLFCVITIVTRHPQDPDTCAKIESSDQQLLVLLLCCIDADERARITEHDHGLCKGDGNLTVSACLTCKCMSQLL